MFLKNLQNSQENTCARDSFFNKVAGLAWPAALLKKRLWHRCFPVNVAKFLRTSFLKITSARLLLFFLKMILIFKLRTNCKLKTKALKNTCAEVDIYILILWTHSFLNWFNIWKCAIKLTNIRYLNSPIILTNMLSFDSAMYFKKKLFRCFILLS